MAVGRGRERRSKVDLACASPLDNEQGPPASSDLAELRGPA